MANFAYGIAFQSDLPLRLPVVDRRPELVVEQLPQPVDRSEARWFDLGLESWCKAARLGDGYYLLFDGEAEFLISFDGSSIRWSCFTEPSPTLTHLLLDHVFPRALTRRGKAILHGACLVSPSGHCYGIVGDSGRGKSTLAAALTARGHRFLADDCVVVDPSASPPSAVAAYPELRLGDDSVRLAAHCDLVEVGDVTRGGPKKRLALPGHDTELDLAHPLGAVFVLGRAGSDEPGLRVAYGPARATIELLSHSFHLSKADERAGAVDRFATIAESCDVRALVYDHSPDGLRRAITDIEDVTSGPSGTS
ncbi:MAG: hypothetical protein OEV40_04270 [Acidimicrobiia bacterium]|nr:hypothetical protein [Acidimicrobiia bacterium]